MKVVQINAVCGQGSTGKICVAISNLLDENGIENFIFYSSGKSSHPNAILCSNKFYTKLQAVKSRILGNYGLNSIKETKKMIALMEKIQPDVVHLHNVHGHDCHLELLFSYLKSRKIKVFWTFHDCWAFTGYCTHFMFEKCEKWKTACSNCPQTNKYSWIFDRSEELYYRKKAAFEGVDLTIITPSQWLADIVSQSFLKDYSVKVIHNGIDLDIFKPSINDFRNKYSISEATHIVLGVAAGWDVRKGLDVFVELSQRLNKEQYQIVLVGTNERVDQELPKNIISIHRTNDQQELAAIYSAADVFVNPTREDNYPTVNMEAIACGTPVVTFCTGGSPEVINEQTGVVVDCDDIDSMEREIIHLCNKANQREVKCVANAANFNKNDRFADYLRLYGGDS